MIGAENLIQEPLPAEGLPSSEIDCVDCVYLNQSLVEIKELAPTWVNLDGSGNANFASPQESQKIPGVKVITVDDIEYPRLIVRGLSKGRAVVIRPKLAENPSLEIIPEKAD